MSVMARTLLPVVLLSTASGVARAEIRTEFSGWVLGEGAPLNTIGGRAQPDGRADASLQLKAFDVSGTGIEYGAQLAQGSARPRETAAYLYTQASWGRVQLGDAPGATAQLLPRAARIGLGQVDGDQVFYGYSPARLAPLRLDDDASTRISYASPAFVGVQLAMSFAPRLGTYLVTPRGGRLARPRGARDLGEIALAGTRSLGAVEFKLGGAYVRSQPGDGWGFGAEASWGSWTLAGGFTHDRAHAAPNVGLSWAGGDVKLGTSWARDQDGRAVVAVGADWTVRPWLNLLADAVRQRERSLVLVAARGSF
jgi:Gram-negative porin